MCVETGLPGRWPFTPPVRAAGDRRVERVAHHVEAIDAAGDEGFLPERAPCSGSRRLMSGTPGWMSQSIARSVRAGMGFSPSWASLGAGEMRSQMTQVAGYRSSVNAVSVSQHRICSFLGLVKTPSNASKLASVARTRSASKCIARTMWRPSAALTALFAKVSSLAKVSTVLSPRSRISRPKSLALTRACEMIGRAAVTRTEFACGVPLVLATSCLYRASSTS